MQSMGDGHVAVGDNEVCDPGRAEKRDAAAPTDREFIRTDAHVLRQETSTPPDPTSEDDGNTVIATVEEVQSTGDGHLSGGGDNEVCKPGATVYRDTATKKIAPKLGSVRRMVEMFNGKAVVEQ